MASPTQQEIEMEENKYAQVLRWIADGEDVQWQQSDGKWINQRSGETLSEIGSEYYAPGRYRLAPRTLTIAGLEIQSPLAHASVGHAVYSTAATGDITKISFSGSAAHYEALKNGRLFATPEAAKAAYDAITALLTGKEGV